MLYFFNLSIYLCIYVLCAKLLYLAICVAHIVTMTHEVCSRHRPQDDVAEAGKFLQKWKTLSDVEKAKKKEEDETLGQI